MTVRRQPKTAQTRPQPDLVVKPVSARNLLEREKRRRLAGVPRLLQHPQLNLTVGAITQIAGPAGAGKTQLALTLCADCLLRNQQAVYICLGGTSSNALSRTSHRLSKMLQARCAQGGRPPAPQETINGWLSNMWLRWVRNAEELMVDLLRDQLPRLLQRRQQLQQQRRISLIVLDDIANVFRIRDDLSKTYYQERAATFFHLSNLCKQMSAEYHVPFLVLNQVTSKWTPEQDSPSLPFLGEEDSFQPALGLSWDQCVNASYLVQRTHAKRATTTHGNAMAMRRLTCQRSPYLREYETVTSNFYIDPRGTVRMVAVDDTSDAEGD